jgi:hypothetical protein
MHLNLENTGIVLDSTADLPDAGGRPNWRVVPLYVRFGDDVYRDYVDMQPDEFYARLRATKEQPRSSQPSPGDFASAVDDLASYERVLVLSISAGLSGTYERADGGRGRSVSADARLRHGLRLRRDRSSGRGDPASPRARHRRRGDRGARRALPARGALRVHARHPRVSRPRRPGGPRDRLAGLPVSLKPILEVTEGEIVPVGRVRGRARSLSELAQRFVRETEDDASVRVGLVHADAEPELEEPPSCCARRAPACRTSSAACSGLCWGRTPGRARSPSAGSAMRASTRY